MYLAKLKVLTSILLVLGAVSAAVYWASRPEPLAGAPQTSVVQASPAAAAQDQKKDVEAKTVLNQAAKAAAAMPATKDEELRRKVDMLVSIGIGQSRAKDLTGAAATFKTATEVAGTIKDELARAGALSHIGFYQAHAGLIADAQKTHDSIVVKDDKKSVQMEAQDLRNKVLVEMASALAKQGDFKQALKTAEAIPVRVLKFKPKPDQKEEERRDTMYKDTALKYVAEAQLKAGDVAGALKTVRAIETYQVRFWTFRDVIIAHGTAGDMPGANQLLQEMRKEMEARKASSGHLYHMLASTQAAMGDATGALTWINQLQSEEDRANALLGLSIGLAERDLIRQPKKGK
jgi:hypothetical protein